MQMARTVTESQQQEALLHLNTASKGKVIPLHARFGPEGG